MLDRETLARLRDIVGLAFAVAVVLGTTVLARGDGASGAARIEDGRTLASLRIGPP